jgi:hypothetical protein
MGAGADVAFKALDFTVSELSKGGITLKSPEQAGVTADKLPDEVRSRLKSIGPVKKTIFTYRSWTGWWDHYSSVDQDGDGPARVRSDTPATVGGYEMDSEVVENANVKLQCIVQYNGPEVRARFDLSVDGMRSRLGTETSIEVKSQLDLETMEAPDNWKKIGLKQFPVIYLPVSIFVDEVWPNDNFKASFNLVLSGMYGFGISSGGSFQQEYREVED